MRKDLNPLKTQKKATGFSNFSDFEVLEEYSLLIALTNCLGRVEVMNIKTLKCIRVMNFHTPNTTTYHFNKLILHRPSGIFCCLQAPKVFQSHVYVGNFRKNYGFSMPFEYSNSTKTIALIKDVLITGGVSSRIRFWDIYNGSFVDEICFNQNSMCITNITPVEEKYMLVCVEETTSSLWLVSLQSKKLMRSIPLDGGQYVSTSPFSGKIACFSQSKKILSFWNILQKGLQKYDIELFSKISVDCLGTFLLISEQSDSQQGLLVYAAKDGIKFKNLSTYQNMGKITMNLRKRSYKQLPMKLYETKSKAQKHKMILIHDGASISIISISNALFNSDLMA